jgi:hypothetical protein
MRWSIGAKSFCKYPRLPASAMQAERFRYQAFLKVI